MIRLYRVIAHVGILFLVMLGHPASSSMALDNEVTVGYQLSYAPWEVAIQARAFEESTGYRIDWRRFDSGAKVVSAMVLGDVQIALLGSAPIAGAISQGVAMRLFWIIADISESEALIVRNASGITSWQGLIGKTIAVPFFSTSHFSLAVAFERFGIDINNVNIINLQPFSIVSAWQRGDIDAAFIWNPVLALLKESGKVLVTAGELNSSTDKLTFDGLVVQPEFAEMHPEFMAQFVKIIAEADESYRSNPAAWTPDSPMVKTMVDMVGGNSRDVPRALATNRFPSLQEQASCVWLGCGNDGGAARSLRATAEFLLAHGQVDQVPGEFSQFVTSKYVDAALGME